MKKIYHKESKFSFLIKLVFLVLIATIPYFIFTKYFRPQKIGINEVTSSTGWLHVSGNKILDSQNQPFTPRSVQYIRVMEDIPNNDASPDIALFYKLNYDPLKVEKDFLNLHNLGYNSIRLVFNNSLDTGFYNYAWQTDPKLHTCKEGTEKPLAECVDIIGINNLVHALQTAKANNLKVILSFIGVTPNAYQTENNKLNNFLYIQAVHDYGRYLKSLFTYLKEKNVLDALLAVQPEAEPFLYTNKNIIPLKSGDIINANNGYNVSQTHIVDDTYFSSKSQWQGHSSLAVKALYNDTIINSFNYWFDTVKSVDPRILTLYDQFPAYNIQTWLEWQIDDMTIVNPSLKADILGMQLYPNNLETSESLSSRLNFTPGFKEAMSLKPFMMVEFGLNKDTKPSERRIPFILNWLKESCSYNISGWNYFNFNEESFSFVTLTQDKDAIGRSLSPKHLTDPCNSNLNDLPLFSSETSTVYLVNQGKKYGFPDGETFAHFGYKQGDQIQVTNDYLGKYSAMGYLTKYIKGSSETAYVMENGVRRQIPNWATFISISPPNSTITQLSDEYVDSLPLGTKIPSIITELPTPKPGDLNGDGKVNAYDFVKLLNGFNTIYTPDDFSNLLANYGK